MRLQCSLNVGGMASSKNGFLAPCVAIMLVYNFGLQSRRTTQLLTVAVRPPHPDSTCAAGLTGQSFKTERRIPYYVLPGCDYLLDAGARCDPDSWPAQMDAAQACCPIGFECAAKPTKLPKKVGKGNGMKMSGQPT